MTQEDKELLLKDLCARLPYGVRARFCDGVKEEIDDVWDIDMFSGAINADYIIDDIQPYLRPMSSMTEEELREFAKLKFKNDGVWEVVEFPEMKFGFRGFINVLCRNKNNGDTWIYQVNTRTPLETYWGTDWLNAHHFDYRGLIEKGLALEAPEGMYKND